MDPIPFGRIMGPMGCYVPFFLTPPVARSNPGLLAPAADCAHPPPTKRQRIRAKAAKRRAKRQ